MLDLTSGLYTPLPGATPAQVPGGAERAQTHAWSPGGEMLLGSFSTGDARCPVRVSLFNGRTAAVEAVLWEGTGVPPQTAWMGEHWAIVGFDDLQVFDFSGRQVAELELGGGMIIAMEATWANRLIALDLNRVVYWIDTQSWTVLDRWHGPWFHAAVSPDGSVVAALESRGKLQFAGMEEDRFRVIGSGEVNADSVAVALAHDRVVTVGGGYFYEAAVRFS